jgi:CHAT domain-containing protein
MIAAIVLAFAIDAEAAAKSFVAALSADSVPAFRALAAEDDMGAQEWFSVREVIERNRCPVIHSYRVRDVQDNVIFVDIDATATSENAFRVERRLPDRWMLTMDGDKLRHAVTLEHLGARLFLASETNEERQRILDEYSLDEGKDLAPYLFDFSTDDVIEARAVSVDAAVEACAAVVEDLEFVLARQQTRNDVAGETAVMRNISICMRLAGKVEESIAWAEAALRVASEANDCDAITGAQALLGEALRIKGNTEAGLALIHAAAMAVDTVDDPRRSIRAAHNYAIFMGRRNDYREAFRMAEFSLQKTLEYGWRWGEGGGWQALGNLYSGFGEPRAAAPHYRRAIATLLEAGNGSWAGSAMANLADHLFEEKRTDEALALIRQAQLLASTYDSYSAGILGIHIAFLIELNRLDEADCVLIEGRARLTESNAGYTNAEAVGLHVAEAELRRRQGRLPEAMYLADMMYATAPENMSSYLTLARALRAMQRGDEARRTLEETVAYAESLRSSMTGDALRRSAYFSQHVHAYYELADLLVEQKHPEEALAIAELVRARAVTDALRMGRSDVRASVTTEERATEDALEQKLRAANQAYLAARMRGGDLARAEQALNHARFEVDRFQTQLGLRHGERLPDTPRTDVDLASVLTSPDIAVVSYAVGAEATLAFAATRDAKGHITVDAIRIPITKEELTARVEKVVASIANRRLDYAKGARAMYDLLVARIARRIGGRSTLCIVPDGVLWELPFHALLDATGEPMIAQHAMFYAPSLTMLRNARSATSPRAASLLAFGNPAFDPRVTPDNAALRGIDLGPLPDTSYEVRQIAQLYPKHVVYTGAAAAEKRFKDEAPHHRVLHLATHGVLQDQWPLFSAVLLAPTDGEDGVVEAREILELQLDADLAVLSACDTARGRIGAGEGIIGMSWALMMAGCRSTVVSQWKAVSASTAELMIAFHRELAQGRSKAAAMRRAQLALRRNEAWRHPFYWAPFIVMGGGQ